MLWDTESEIMFVLTDKFNYELSLVVDIRANGRMITDICLDSGDWFTVDETDTLEHETENHDCYHLGKLIVFRLSLKDKPINIFQCSKCGRLIG